MVINMEKKPPCPGINDCDIINIHYTGRHKEEIIEVCRTNPSMCPDSDVYYTKRR